MKVFWINVLFYPIDLILRVFNTNPNITVQPWLIPSNRYVQMISHVEHIKSSFFYFFDLQYLYKSTKKKKKLKQAVNFYTCQGKNKIIIVSRTKSSLLFYLDHFHIFENFVACGLYLLALNTISKLQRCCKRVNIIQ